MTTRNLKPKATSRNLMGYSLMKFFLLAASSGSSSNSAGDPRINTIRERKYKILVIDDDDEFRKSFCFKLKRKYKAQVEDVVSGRAGVEKLRNGNAYDFIFTDIMMPEMTGIQAYHELRKIDGKIRIVMMSAYSDSDEWKKAQGLDVPLLHKPIPEDQLVKILGA